MENSTPHPDTINALFARAGVRAISLPIAVFPQVLFVPQSVLYEQCRGVNRGVEISGGLRISRLLIWSRLSALRCPESPSWFA